VVPGESLVTGFDSCPAMNQRPTLHLHFIKLALVEDGSERCTTECREDASKLIDFRLRTFPEGCARSSRVSFLLLRQAV
jgi:hypothetical protein